MDEGRSGFHGTHRTKGALGKFLYAVEAGKVPVGSILLVENIDRLSREGIGPALREIIFKLLDAGITLVTLSPEETYGPGCENDTKFLALLLYLARAHDESKRKSERIANARDTARHKAREEGRVMTAMCPAWLTPKQNRDGFDFVKAAARTVRMIYEWAADGVSSRKIESKLNDQAPWSPPSRLKSKRAAGESGNGWRTSYIKKILSNRAVIGEYQPFVRRHGKDGPREPIGDPIPDYYPRIVEPELFYAVQKKLEANRGKGGRTGKVCNVLTHLVKCAYCGGPMRYVNKGKPPKGAEYLMCDHGVRGVGCKASHRIRYHEAVRVLLDNCEALKPEQVLPRPDEQAKLCQNLRSRLSGIEGQIAEAERQLENLADAVANRSDGKVLSRLVARMEAAEASKSELEQQRRQTERDLHEAESALRSFAEWKQNLASLKEALTGDDPEPRLRLRSHLRDFISRIDVYSDGYPAAGEPGPSSLNGTRATAGQRYKFELPLTDNIADAAYDAASESGQEIDGRYAEFVVALVARRLSREGRFLRVHYKGGGVIDLVPPGSLATGSAVTDGKNWRSLGPDIGKLWAAFVKSQF